MKSFLEDIREQIAKGRLDFGLNQLHHALSTFEADNNYKKEERKELERDLTLFSHEYNSIQAISRGGTSGREDLDLKKNQLIDRILNLLMEIAPNGRFPFFSKHLEKVSFEQNEDDAWLQASKGNSMASFQNYLHNYPEGQFSATAKQIIEVLHKNEDTGNLFPGAILYGKIKGFSLLDREDPIFELIEKTVIQEYVAKDPSIKLVFFSGGSFALFFKRMEETSAATTLKAFLFGIYIQLTTTFHGRDFKIGITLDWENDAKPKEANQQYYLLCKALDYANMYMSFSDKEHFFLSNQIVNLLGNHKLKNIEENAGSFPNLMALLEEEFKNEKSRFDPFFTQLLEEIKNLYSSLNTSADSNPSFKVKEFKYFDKSKAPHTLHNFFAADNKLQIGKQYTPYDWTFLEKRDEREFSPRQKFIKKLVEADKVCIIGITHEGTKGFLAEALKERNNKFWDELQIVFPNREIIETILDEREVEERKNAWEGARRSLFLFLIEQTKDHGPNNWQCLEFDRNLPFIGNKLIGKKNSVIRIAPILPGESAKEVFYTEILEGTKAYDQLSKAFDRVCELSLPLNERLVFGKLNQEKSNILYKGLLERTILDKFIQETSGLNYCFPVVLVMLHTQKFGKRYSILQKRTELNATGDTGTYSNISGRIIDLDVLRSSSNTNLIQRYLELISKILKHSLEKNMDADYFDEIKSAFENMLGQEEPLEISMDAWKQAAVREIKEELGLFINKTRLEYQRTAPLPKVDYSLFFCIFSLDLSNKEFEKIEKLRPDADLKPFSFNELESYWAEQKLNRLLQSEFHTVFVPIFEKLGIWKER